MEIDKSKDISPAVLSEIELKFGNNGMEFLKLLARQIKSEYLWDPENKVPALDKLLKALANTKI